MQLTQCSLMLQKGVKISRQGLLMVKNPASHNHAFVSRHDYQTCEQVSGGGIYVVATSTIISGWATTCDSAHS